MTPPSHNSPEAATRPGPASARRRGWAVWLATGLGAGYGPVMPGTYGSVLGVGLYLLLTHFALPLPHSRLFLYLATMAVAGLSLPVVAIALRSFTVLDPQEIVLDEVVGQLVTLLPLPLAPQRHGSYWVAITLGFLLFRVLDAAKPYPIWKLERLKGAWGIVADDVGAGVVAAVILAGLLWLGWKI